VKSQDFFGGRKSNGKYRKFIMIDKMFEKKKEENNVVQLWINQLVTHFINK